jgi:hypothetical protein
VAARSRAGAALPGECFRVRLPAGLAQLGVDEVAGVGLVQLELLAGPVGGVGELLEGLRRPGGGAGLEGGQLLDESLFGLLGELLPGGAVLGVAAGALLGVEAAAGLGLGGGASRLHVEPRGIEGLAQALQLGGEGGVLLGGIGRRDEGAGLEVGLAAEGAVEPEAQLAGHLELVEGLAMGGAGLVDGLVAGDAQGFEELAHVRGEDRMRGLGELADELSLGEAAGGVEAEVGGDAPGEQLAELAQLHQAGDGVLGEVALGLGGQGHQQGVVGGEELEVRRGGRGHAEPTAYPTPRRGGPPSVHPGGAPALSPWDEDQATGTLGCTSFRGQRRPG